jgi:hypothetical protein
VIQSKTHSSGSESNSKGDWYSRCNPFLAKYFEQVGVSERDRVTASAASRSGTPQDWRPLGVLAGGLWALGEIFPGFDSDLARAGAVSVRIAWAIQCERPDVSVLPQRDSAYRGSARPGR